MLISSGDADSFTSLCVIVFRADIALETVQWVMHKIKAKLSCFGADLKAEYVTTGEEKIISLHVGASTGRLLDGAEYIELKKEDRDGLLREFYVGELDSFKNSEDEDNFLTECEKQRIVLHELENIRCQEGEPPIPGLSAVNMYPGQSIVRKLLKEAIIVQVYPLHDTEELKRLGSQWYDLKKVASRQPVNQIRDYFGETIAMYFVFLSHYTISLIPPAIVGLLYFFTKWRNVNRHSLFAIFNVIWTIVFMKTWKRKCASHAYKWGSLHVEKFEEARAEYYGIMGTNYVTGRQEPIYPKWKRIMKFYGLTVPVILICLGVAVYVMFVYFWLEKLAIQRRRADETFANQILTYVPSICYTVVILIMNEIYRRIAKVLNEWENHRLQSAYDNHLVVKLVLFDFVNNFLSLFYIAFYMQDMATLRQTLATFVIVQQLIGQIQESLIPFILVRRRANNIRKKQNHLSRNTEDAKERLQSDVSDAEKKQAELEGAMQQYEGTLDDYLELFLQYGYVFLFSSVFPMAAFWALINNITEIRSDAFKLCRTFQRPFSKPASGIGAWQVAFEVLGVIAVMTNCALIAISPSGLTILADLGTIKFVMLFVVAEHCVLAIQMMLLFIIPDVPRWVQKEVAKIEYQSKQAWRNEFIKGNAKRNPKKLFRQAVGLFAKRTKEKTP